MRQSCLLLMLCISLPFTVGSVRAAEADIVISATELFGFGLFETSSSSRQSSFSKEAVAADAVRGVHFTTFTDRVPMILHTNFGFQYAINSTPHGQQVAVRSVIHFPEPGLRTPGGKVYRKSVERKQVQIGVADLHGYGFDEPWEMVPGDWVFEIWYGDTMLIRKTFVVEEAPQTTATDEE